MKTDLKKENEMKKKTVVVALGLGLMAMGFSGCLSYSHYKYSRRAEAARALPEGVKAKPGRIYFVSFPENELELSLWGWHPNVGHAALVTSDGQGAVKQYDYGWFVGYGGKRPDDAIGYVDESEAYGVVRRKAFDRSRCVVATNDLEIARLAFQGTLDKNEKGEMVPLYGNKVELWAKDVADIGIAERYMEQLAADKDRGSMAWRCWQIGGYRCGNITRQAFDAARGEWHFLDLLWGGFPGADAPSVGTEKTVFVKEQK